MGLGETQSKKLNRLFEAQLLKQNFLKHSEAPNKLFSRNPKNNYDVDRKSVLNSKKIP
jgi:hypothetical protein